MLGKRSRPIQKTTVSTPDTEGIDSNNTNKHSLFITPRIFIGFKPSLDPEGAKSPTSPLDIKTFSGVGISYLHDKQLRSPRPSALEALSSPRPWERKNSQGIGLGIVASLTNTTSDCSNTITSVQGSKLRIFVGGSMGSPKNPSSPPRAVKDAVEDGGEELEHSESYTCVISHGPQCSTKHIYTSDEVVKFSVETRHHSEICNNGASSSSSTAAFCVSSDDAWDYTMGDFLTSCYLCKKKLSAGKDIYMYRGDKAFCSVECRYQQILSDERNEAISGSPPSSVFVFGSSIAA